MKIRRSTLTSLALTLMLTASLLMSMTLSAAAESPSYEGNSTFNGKTIVSDFNSNMIAEAVTNLQPGDDVTFTVSYTNEYKGDTDWYVENSIIQTLEATAGSDAENGGYTYELIHVDSNNNSETIFSNEKVGGEAKPNNMEGLEQATNALDDWFFLETLGYQESGSVILHVAFEGETQANDYMDTEGELELRFAVEIPENDRIVRTGDNTMIRLWTAVCMLAGALLLILAVFSRRRDRREAYAEAAKGKGGDQ